MFTYLKGTTLFGNICHGWALLVMIDELDIEFCYFLGWAKITLMLDDVMGFPWLG